MNKRYLTLCLGVSMGLGLSSTVQAQDASPITGSATLVSNYLFRGLSQTNGDPAIQAGFQYDNPSGFYAGVWGSSISWLSDYDDVSSSVELDFYAGYKGSFSDTVSFDVGVLRYQYPGNYPSGFVSPNTTEGYAAIGFSTLSFKYSHAFTNAFGFGDSKNSDYLDLSWNQPFAERWVFNAHIGHQRIDGFDDANYTDWKLGATVDLGNGFSLAAAYIDTNAEKAIYTNAYGKFLAKQTGVLTLNKAF